MRAVERSREARTYIRRISGLVLISLQPSAAKMSGLPILDANVLVCTHCYGDGVADANGRNSCRNLEGQNYLIDSGAV
jgi:hypothetical protein